MAREFPSFTLPAGDAFSESAHPRASNGQFGSGGGGEESGKRTPVKWPSQGEIAARKKNRETDLAQATLRAGGLPAGWKMNGGRKVPPR